jgi:hypothetical protein
MRSLIVLMLLCLLFLFVTYQQTSSAGKPELTVAAGLKSQTKEAYDALAIYGRNYREKLRQDVKASAVLFDQEIQTLANKVRETSMNAREQFTRTLNDWRGRKELLEGKLKDVKATCVAAWEAAKREISKRIEGLKELYDPPSSANS